jgi:hypothetical protein
MDDHVVYDDASAYHTLIDNDPQDMDDREKKEIKGIVLPTVVDVEAIAKIQVYVEAEHLSVIVDQGNFIVLGALATAAHKAHVKIPQKDVCRLWTVLAPATTQGTDDNQEQRRGDNNRCVLRDG